MHIYESSIYIHIRTRIIHAYIRIRIRTLKFSLDENLHLIILQVSFGKQSNVLLSVRYLYILLKNYMLTLAPGDPGNPAVPGGPGGP